MRPKRDGKRPRWDPNFSNQRSNWNQWQSNSVPQGFPGPWAYDQRMPAPRHFSEMDQFHLAYHSDRYDNYHNSHRNKNTYDPPCRNYNQNENNWNGATRQRQERNNQLSSNNGDVWRRGDQSRSHREGNNMKNQYTAESTSRMNREDSSSFRASSDDRQRCGRSIRRNVSSTENPSPVEAETTQNESFLNRPEMGVEAYCPSVKSPSNFNRNESIRGPDRSVQVASELSSNKKGNDSLISTASSLKSTRKAPNEQSNVSPKEKKGNNGHHGRGGSNSTSLLGRPPQPLSGNQWNRCNASREEDRMELNNWLEMSKGQEPISERGKSPVSRNPLPGSEEARSNAIKEATDRLKQALKQKKNVNLNELLSSGDESKGESQANSKQNPYPKNLAQLELDASDMRAIGRANTEKANVPEDYDDDIIELARSPSPVCPVIDLDVSPKKPSSTGASQEESDISYNPSKEVSVPSSQGNFLSAEGSELLGHKSVPKARAPCKNKPSHFNLKSPRSKDFNHAAEVSTRVKRNIDSRRVSVSQCETETINNIVKSETISSPEASLNVIETPAHLSDENMHNDSAVSPFSINQQRRRSSSTCEPAIRHVESNQPQQTTLSPFKCRSPPFLEKGIHDSRQRKIISDLQKMSRSNLKDLINNPRSGKLDFAMRQLMKEHRSALSRKSRDTAEKRIPVEFLNPKSTELPHDDSSLLVDFDIDWHSLPGELISTLGDLFQDINPDVMVPDLQSQNVEKSCNLENVSLQLSNEEEFVKSDEEISFLPPTNRKKNIPKDDDTPQIIGSSQPIKIRVCQFARESQLLSESDGELNCQPTVSENVNSDCPFLPVTQPVNLCSNAHNSLELSSCTDTVRPNVTPRQHSNFESDDVEALGLPSDWMNNGGGPTENLVICAPNMHQDKNDVCQPPPGSKQQAKSRKESPAAKKKSKHRQRKLVCLEERTWFEDTTVERNVASNGQSNLNEDASINAEIVSSNPVDVNNVEECVSGVNIVPFDKQCVSMLPVLMMTVPANGVSDTIGNMTHADMVKELQEVDVQLQNLVQRRFILAQAIKSLQSDGGQAVTGPVVELVNTVPINPPCTTLVSDDCEDPHNGDADQSIKMTSKRKSSENDNDIPSKKKQKSVENGHGIASAGSSKTQTSPNSTSIIGCPAQIESTSQSSVQNNTLEKSEKKTETVVFGGDQGKNDTGSVSSGSESFNPKQLVYTRFENISGNILDMRIHNRLIYAASQAGIVYSMVVNSGIQALYSDKKTPSVFTCLEIVSIPNSASPVLFVGGSDGVLRAYQTRMNSPEKNIQPIARHKVNPTSLHCLEANWGFIYVGTKAGFVIPFNVKNSSAGEPLNVAGYPVLAIKSCMEGPRKVIIVACRQQPLAIRDAESGLLLRTLGGSDWNVYSIVLYKNWVLCGTGNSKVISVFDFQSGEKAWELSSGTGVIDMKLIEAGSILFCGCYDGKIYIYNLQERKLLCSFAGPGRMVLCIGLVRKRIICSAKENGLVYWYIPGVVKHCLKQNSSQSKAIKHMK